MGVKATEAAVSAADLVVLCSQALRTSVQELAPAFEQTTGRRLHVEVAPSGVLQQRVRAGEQADVLIASATALAELERDGFVATGSTVPIAYAQVGIAVRAGSPRPDISSPDAVRRTFIEAKSVAYSQGGLSGNNFEKVLDGLSILHVVRAKARFGSPAACFLIRGEAEIAVQQIPELVAVDGAELVGPLPLELDQVTPFSCGLLTKAKQPDLARAWIDLLTSAEAATVMRAKGLTPAPDPI